MGALCCSSRPCWFIHFVLQVEKNEWSQVLIIKFSYKKKPRNNSYWAAFRNNGRHLLDFNQRNSSQFVFMGKSVSNLAKYLPSKPFPLKIIFVEVPRRFVIDLERGIGSDLIAWSGAAGRQRRRRQRRRTGAPFGERLRDVEHRLHRRPHHRRTRRRRRRRRRAGRRPARPRTLRAPTRQGESEKTNKWITRRSTLFLWKKMIRKVSST